MSQPGKKDGPPRSVHRYHFPPLSQQEPLPEEQPYASPQQIAAKYQALMEEGRDAGFAEGLRQGLEQGHPLGQERGFQVGMQEGREAGSQQAYEESKPKLDDAFHQVGQLYDSLEATLQETLTGQRETLCRLISQICRQVLRAELALNPTQILGLIEETLAMLPKPQGAISIRLDPGTHTLLKACAPEALKNWDLQSDPLLCAGSFHIQTGLAEAESQLDARIDLCVDQLRRQLVDTPELNALEAPAITAESQTISSTITPHNLPWRKEETFSSLSLPADKFSDEDLKA